MKKVALSPLTQRLLAGGGAGALGGALIGGATEDEGQQLAGALRGGAIGLGAGLLGGGGYHLLQGTPQAKQVAQEAAAAASLPRNAKASIPQAVAPQASIPQAVAPQASIPQAVASQAAPRGRATTLPARRIPNEVSNFQHYRKVNYSDLPDTVKGFRKRLDDDMRGLEAAGLIPDKKFHTYQAAETYAANMGRLPRAELLELKNEAKDNVLFQNVVDYMLKKPPTATLPRRQPLPLPGPQRLATLPGRQPLRPALEPERLATLPGRQPLPPTLEPDRLPSSLLESLPGPQRLATLPGRQPLPPTLEPERLPSSLLESLPGPQRLATLPGRQPLPPTLEMLSPADVRALPPSLGMLSPADVRALPPPLGMLSPAAVRALPPSLGMLSPADVRALPPSLGMLSPADVQSLPSMQSLGPQLFFGPELVSLPPLPPSLPRQMKKTSAYKIALSPLTQRMLTGAGIGAVGGGLGGAFLSDDPDVKMDALKGALLGAGVGALGGGTYHAFAGSPAAQAAQAAQAAPYASTLLPSEPVRAPYMESIAGGPVRAPYMESIAGGPVRAPSLASPAAPFVVGADPMAPLVVGAAPGSAKAVADMAKKAALAHYGLVEKTALSVPAQGALLGALGGGLGGLGYGALHGGVTGAVTAEDGQAPEGALSGAVKGSLAGAGIGALGGAALGGYGGYKVQNMLEALELAKNLKALAGRAP